MPHVILLGPQRFHPTVAGVLESLALPAGPVSVVTAGWQERESEIDELQDHVDRDAINLALHLRCDRVLADDPDLAAALAERQEELRRVQALYRLQLSPVLASARALVEREDAPWVEDHRRSAIRLVKTLDRQHLTRVKAIHDSFERLWQPSTRDSVRRHRDQIGERLGRSRALLIAGGNVATLINRLRLFDLLPLCGDLPVVAWSGGAMVLGERVVLFHDHPPQGPGDAEVLEAGLAWHTRLVPLPHAEKRLDLADPSRVQLFARRFSPAQAAILDGGARIDWRDGAWHAFGHRRLTRAGRIAEVRA